LDSALVWAGAFEVDLAREPDGALAREADGALVAAAARVVDLGVVLAALAAAGFAALFAALLAARLVAVLAADFVVGLAGRLPLAPVFGGMIKHPPRSSPAQLPGGPVGPQRLARRSAAGPSTAVRAC
jgi:hypothetical protein